MRAPSQPVDPAPSETEGSTESAALLRLVADGTYHRFDDLALQLGGKDQPGSRARVAALLADLHSLGMAMQLDADGVLATAFVPLESAAIRAALGTTVDGRPPMPWRVRVAHALDSTNSTLMTDVKHPDRPRGPALVAAELQLAGRGRMGRDWQSAPGTSLTASFAIEVGRGMARLDGVTLVCGLAVHGVVRALGSQARLKWPNDVLVDGRKLAGILVEAHATDAARTTLVVGIGINVAFVAEPVDRVLALPAAMLARSSTPVDRNRLVASLARALDAELAIFETRGFAAFAWRWNAEDAFRDQRVALVSGNEPPTVGIARGVDDGGALLVDVDGTRRRIIAGDVSLRPLVQHLKVEAA